MKRLIQFALLISSAYGSAQSEGAWSTGAGELYANSILVGIGTDTPDSPLSVNGTIHAQEVIVDLQNWPDYVFEENYPLRPLNELEVYIISHNHLPEIPSAAFVQQNGVELGETSKLLLRKIEELTLYLLEENKLMKELSMVLNHKDFPK